MENKRPGETKKQYEEKRTKEEEGPKQRRKKIGQNKKGGQRRGERGGGKGEGEEEVAKERGKRRGQREGGEEGAKETGKRRGQRREGRGGGERRGEPLYKEQTCLRCTSVLVAVAASSKEENHSRKYSAAAASPRRFLPRSGFSFILQSFRFSHVGFWHIYKFYSGVWLPFLLRKRLSGSASVCAVERMYVWKCLSGCSAGRVSMCLRLSMYVCQFACLFNYLFMSPASIISNSLKLLYILSSPLSFLSM